jgi:Flp pilus assembly protein TadB
MQTRTVFDHLKVEFEKLKSSRPGHRFQDHHERKRREEQSRSKARRRWITFAYIAVGSLLIAAGVVFSLTPGIPGFVLFIPGLALLVARSARLARTLDHIELSLRRWRRKVQH